MAPKWRHSAPKLNRLFRSMTLLAELWAAEHIAEAATTPRRTAAAPFAAPRERYSHGKEGRRRRAQTSGRHTLSAAVRRTLPGARRTRLGDAAGLTQYGVNLLRLPPSAWSSQRHWHT